MPDDRPVSPRLSLIIPAFDEAQALPATLDTVVAAARATRLAFEVVVVDDGSRDATWPLLVEEAATVPELRAIRLSRNFGKEGAIAAGLDAARGDAVIVLDADLQHPPGLIPEMVRLWTDEGWQVVEATKVSRSGDGWLRRAAARGFYRAAGLLTGYALGHDSDYKLLDRRVVDAWRQFGERATFFRGLVSWLGFRRTAIPFDVPARVSGRSRWSWLALLRLAVQSITSFSALPLQLVTLLGLGTLLLALGIGVQALRLWYEGRALPGFTTVILLQLIIGGVLMVSLGIIGTYVARIYDEVKGRPRYVVQETTRHD
jgi:glycosyltransferase involved in cell wall biosynthesis